MALFKTIACGDAIYVNEVKIVPRITKGKFVTLEITADKDIPVFHATKCKDTESRQEPETVPI